MAKIFIEQSQEIIEVAAGVLMVHKLPPTMVVIVDEVLADGLSFFGTDLAVGFRQEYDMAQFDIFRGKLTLEQ
ncbi:hypothetical protein Roomu2_00156 [Pseudomonas phage vB_PpuM-Roomu-2]|uniref:Uncharacterized protein n=2 Tax=Tartuvirus TaxID=3424912 RepID=A0AAX4MX71_9CAUD